MSDGQGDAPAVRPRPAYGEYATPEEQRARIQQPDATAAISSGQAVVAAPASAPQALGPLAAGAPVKDAPDRTTDRIVTIALLVAGAFNVAITVFSYFDLPSLANQAMQILGIPGEFTNVESAQLWGPIAAGALIVGYLLTAFFAWRGIRAKRVSWWIPLVGAFVSYVVVYVCLSIPLLGDPAFIQYATSTG